MQANLIPTVDPNPLPAPYGVLKLLLLVTFCLHLLAMNCLLGCGVLALVAKWRLARKDFRQRLFADLVKKLPVLMPATVSLGVAPLLFIQVLYGQFFYTSSILMAWPWFLVLFLVTIAYYGLYWVSYRAGQSAGRAGAVLLVSVVLLVAVGFLYSNNLTLSQMPAKWGAKYFGNPAGWNLNLSEVTLLPRYLHFLTAAIALGGLFLTWMAYFRWQDDREYARAVLRFGGKAFLYATMAQFVIGFLFLASLPREQGMLFLGGDALGTSFFVLGFFGAGGAIVVVSRSLRAQNVGRTAWLGSGITAAVVCLMVVMRDILRSAYLQPHFHSGQLAVKTQWSVFLLFVVIFVLGLGLWLLMVVRYFSAAKEQGPQHPHIGQAICDGEAQRL